MRHLCVNCECTFEAYNREERILFKTWWALQVRVSQFWSQFQSHPILKAMIQNCQILLKPPNVWSNAHPKTLTQKLSCTAKPRLLWSPYAETMLHTWIAIACPSPLMGEEQIRNNHRHLSPAMARYVSRCRWRCAASFLWAENPKTWC